MPIIILGASRPAYAVGTILGQTVNFVGEQKKIGKVSTNLTLVSEESYSYFVENEGYVSFQASNFQSSRDDYVFQPVISPSFVSCGTPIQNSFQSKNYTDETEIINNAPYLKYNIYFSTSGLYYLWAYACPDLLWTLSDDTTNLRVMTWLCIKPTWSNFGSFYIKEGGLYTFTVYSCNANTTLLDQWFFTTNDNLDNVADYASDLSDGPFNTAIRVRSLYNEEVDSLNSPQASPAHNSTSWLSSNNIKASGKFNYEIRDSEGEIGITFTDGLSIEYWQIGGSSKFFASFDYREAT